MQRWMQICAFAFAATVATPRLARADVSDWQVNEVLTSLGGDTGIRYVELRNDPGGCFFPSSRIESFDAAGNPVDSVSPFVVTTCFGPGTYFLLATSGAVAQTGATADRLTVPQLPVASGQLCFSSSTTRYDCVRWGTISDARTDLFGSTDTTSVAPHPDGMALARQLTTHVVATDWSADSPTPRGPNDGTPWFPPDAGPTPDARPMSDAAPVPDAMPLPDSISIPDAGERFDASPNRFLDLEARGGPACSCTGSGDSRDSVGLVLLVAMVAILLRRWGRYQPPRIHGMGIHGYQLRRRGQRGDHPLHSSQLHR